MTAACFASRLALSAGVVALLLLLLLLEVALVLELLLLAALLLLCCLAGRSRRARCCCQQQQLLLRLNMLAAGLSLEAATKDWFAPMRVPGGRVSSNWHHGGTLLHLPHADSLATLSKRMFDLCCHAIDPIAAQRDARPAEHRLRAHTMQQHSLQQRPVQLGPAATSTRASSGRQGARHAVRCAAAARRELLLALGGAAAAAAWAPPPAPAAAAELGGNCPTCLGAVDGTLGSCSALDSCASTFDDRPPHFVAPWMYEGRRADAVKQLIGLLRRLGADVVADGGAADGSSSSSSSDDYVYVYAVLDQGRGAGALDMEFLFPNADNTVALRAAPQQQQAAGGRASGGMLSAALSALLGGNQPEHLLDGMRQQLGWEVVPVLRNRQRALLFGESPFDTFGPVPPPTMDYERDMSLLQLELPE